MKRNSTSSLGALHPVFFMLMIYVFSVMLAIFVCTTIYNSLAGTTSLAHKQAGRIENLTVLK